MYVVYGLCAPPFRNGVVGSRLRAALQWWSRVLALDISELREWQHVDNGVCHLFVDAASSPARCAAVLFHDGEVSYTDAAPNDAMWALLKERRDKQITGLEIWAIALGLSTFQEQIRGKTVFLYSDNTGVCAFPFDASVHRLVGFSACPWQVRSTALRRAQLEPSTTTRLSTVCGCRL